MDYTLNKTGEQIDNDLDFIEQSVYNTNDVFSTTESYSIGSLVIYNNKLYKAISEVTPGSWNSAKWEETTLNKEMNSNISSIRNGNASKIKGVEVEFYANNIIGLEGPGISEEWRLNSNVVLVDTAAYTTSISSNELGQNILIEFYADNNELDKKYAIIKLPIVLNSNYQYHYVMENLPFFENIGGTEGILQYYYTIRFYRNGNSINFSVTYNEYQLYIENNILKIKDINLADKNRKICKITKIIY